MKLKKLLKDIPNIQIKGPKDTEINGICSNSKLVAPGNLFIARKGMNDDGSRYIPEAISGGAVAVLSDIYDPSLKEVAQVIHPDVAHIEGLLAAYYYQFPSEELFMVGITGTNGKTTTSFIVRHLLNQLDASSGLIGTIEYIIGKHRYQATRTTPDVLSNHKMLREMVLHGCQSAVMEVTSHALEQGRVDNIDFDVAIFTNLTLDHLDYHGSMDNYCLSKNKLFKSLQNIPTKKTTWKKTAVVNLDSPWHGKITAGCSAQILTYGIENSADLQATEIELSSQGTKFNLRYKGKTYPCQIPLVGRFNVYNTLAALGAVLSKGVPFDKALSQLNTIPPVNGRLQPVPNPLNLKIYIDFAHSDDALANVLECLNELKKGKIITVFGCGGNRDQTKRPKMAQVSESLSDISVVTSDNPRTEVPENIIQDIVKGFKNKEKYLVEVDRKNAIEKAISLATPNDIVLIAGKGHETYQIFAHKTVEFDDAKVALQVCEERSRR